MIDECKIVDEETRARGKDRQTDTSLREIMTRDKLADGMPGTIARDEEGERGEGWGRAGRIIEIVFLPRIRATPMTARGGT